MMSWKLALRHLSRQWSLNLMLLAIMFFGASFLASLPIIAAVIAGDSLSQTLARAPVHVRNIVVQGTSKTDEPPEEIESILGELLGETMAVREGDVRGFTIIAKPDGTQLNLYPATLILNLRSFDRLDQRVKVLEGRLPEPNAVYDDDNEAVFEVAIGMDTASRVGLGLGDEISPLIENYHLRVVGIIEPDQPDAEIWWGDRQLSPFTAWRRIYTSPDIDEWNVSLVIHPEAITKRIFHQQYWRVIVDRDKITASNATSVRETLIELQSSLSEKGMTVTTDLIEVIARFEEALALAQVSLLLLTFQSLIAVFYLMGMFGNFLVAHSRMELVTLSGRGFSRAQIAALFARLTGLLALLAVIVSPLAAYWILALWANWQGNAVPNLIPVESWWLALATGLFSWIFLVISIYRAIGQDFLTGQGQGIRYTPQAQGKQHLIWDLFILTLGGLAFWQLTQGGRITHEVTGPGEVSATRIADLVLLLGPTLLLLAVALILIRLLPYLWRLFAWITRKGQGLVWNLVFTRFARYPVGPGQVTLLISLTAGLTLFASVFGYSVDQWQKDMARYVTGADIRIRQPLMDSAHENIPGLPGIVGETQVVRAEATFLVDEYQRINFDLLAVNPDTFSSVVSYPAGISSYSMMQVIGALDADSPDVLPVIISSSAQTHHLNIGDQITLEAGADTVPFEIVGIIINFPLLGDIFAITDLSQFTQKVNLESLNLIDQGSNEIWLAVEPEEHGEILAKLNEAGLGDMIAGNSISQLDIFQNNLVFREVTTAFGLNTLVLIPLSVVGLFMILLFSVQRRTDEFYVLQTIGLSKEQLRGMLIREGSVYIILGLLIGIGIGFGLILLMQPFLSQILPPLRNDVVLNRIQVDWLAIAIQFLVLLCFYGFGYLILMFNIVRKQRLAQI